MSSLLVQTQFLSGKRVVVAGKYLIIQLKRYLLNDGVWVKDMSLVNCVMDSCLFLSI